MAKRSRSRVWIDRQIQGALAVRVAGHWCIFALVASVLTLAMQYVANPVATWEQQVANVWRNQGPFLIVMLVLLPVFLYDTVKLSNRFAGPVLRLRRVMQSINRGEPIEKLAFRDNDFWRGLAADFNKLVDRGYFESAAADEEVSSPDSDAQRVS